MTAVRLRTLAACRKQTRGSRHFFGLPLPCATYHDSLYCCTYLPGPCTFLPCPSLPCAALCSPPGTHTCIHWRAELCHAGAAYHHTGYCKRGVRASPKSYVTRM
jgi:hypothetical protein